MTLNFGGKVCTLLAPPPTPARPATHSLSPASPSRTTLGLCPGPSRRSQVIKDCVITVPASFTQHERRALYTAAEIADLKVPLPLLPPGPYLGPYPGPV